VSERVIESCGEEEGVEDTSRRRRSRAFQRVLILFMVTQQNEQTPCNNMR